MELSTSVGYLVGAFDMFNVAHLSVINQVRNQCEFMVVAVLSDDDVTIDVGRAPVIPFDERVEILQHVRGIDQVVGHSPAALAEFADAVVFSIDDRSDVTVDVIVAPDELPDNEVLWRAISRQVGTVAAS